MAWDPKKLTVHLSVFVLLTAACTGTAEQQEQDQAAADRSPTDQPQTDETAVQAEDGASAGGEPQQRGPRSPEAEERNATYAAWDPADMEARRQEVGLEGPGPASEVPEPNFPDYLREPEGMDDLLPQARDAVRQTGGRVPLGLTEPGEVAAIVVPYDADPAVQEAMVEAFKERGIEARILWEHELAEVSKEDLVAIEEVEDVFQSGDGQREGGPRFEQHGDWYGDGFDRYKEWLLERDPVAYYASWPELEYPDEDMAELSDNYGTMVTESLIKYLDENEDVTRVYYRTGGRTGTRSSLLHHGDKFMGNYTYINHYDLMSQVPAFPADVWRMLETKTIEPLAFVDRAEITDPEGTALAFDLSEEQAQAWFDGVYQQGHLYMMPNQATGRRPYSLVDYPAQEGHWNDPVIVRSNGYLAGTNSHATSQNRIEYRITDGYLESVEGGGLYGDMINHAMEYPGINELTWPFWDEPGFMHLFEAGTGTNPKYFKHPTEILEGQNSSERNVGGVIHFAFGKWDSLPVGVEGVELDGQPVDPAEEIMRFSEEEGMPGGHAFHNHNLMPTYQVRLRDGGEWVTLIEHGDMQAYHDPEVRALASRYGDPDVLLNRDWIPELPGINAPGNYDEDYGSRAGDYWVEWSNSIVDGTNEYIGHNQP